MTTAIQPQHGTALDIPDDLTIGALEKALTGDLKHLTGEQRLKFLAARCKSVGLNPLTQPFDYVELSGKLVLYANKGCAEQLRQIHGVSLEIAERAREGSVYFVRVRAKDRNGRTDESIGAVAVDERATADFVALAMMRAETKAKRRATLSICGLGLLDVSEVDDLRGAKRIVDVATEETTADKIARMNAAIAAQAEPEPVKTEPPPALPMDTEGNPKWNAPVAPPRQPVPEPSTSVEDVAEPSLTEDEAAQLEKVIGLLADPRAGVEYIITRGKLERGKGLRFVNRDYFNKIMANKNGWLGFVRKSLNAPTK